MKDKPVILIVDDLPASIELLETYLAGQGYEIVTASNGEEALEKIAGNQIDLVLLDVMMPGMDGFEVTRRVRQDDAHRLLPIIIITALQAKEDRIKGIEAGCDDFISKSADKMELRARVRSLLKVKAYNDLLSHYQKELEAGVTGRTKELKRALEDLQHEITERKRLELELSRANEKNILNIIDSAVEGILLADTGSRKFYRGNPAICRMLGYSLEEIKKLGLMDIYSEKDIPYIINQLERQATGEFTLSRDVPVKRKDGVVIYADVNSTTITFSGKKYLLGFFHDSTGRRQAEAQREEMLELLRKSEKYFKEITENSSDIIIITEKNGNIKYCSRSIERFTGYKPEELIGRSGSSIIHPDDKKRAAADYGKAIRTTESAIPNSFRIVCKDGSERCFEGLGKNLLDHPDVAGFIMNVRDITERRQAEAQRESALEELRQSEEKYRTILENMQEAYYENDLEGRFTLVNDKLCKDLGRTKEELLGSKYSSYLDETETEKTFRAYNELYKTGKPIKSLETNVYKDGTNRLYEISIDLIRDAKGMPAGFRAMSRDITERKRAEEALHEGESSIRAITDSARDAILMMDPEGRISYWNPAAERILGYTSAEAIGQNMHALIAPSRYHEAHHAAFPVFQQKGQGAAVGKTLDLEARRKDGKEISVQLSLAAIHMKSAWHAVGILRDVTEQMQAQNAIKESEEKFRNIVLWSVDAIIVTDANGKIVFVNPAAGRVFNREVEGFIGTDFALPLADGQSTEIDIFRPGKGQGVGDMYVVETEWMGEKAHLITIRDITERKQIEVKIKNAQEDLFIINNKLEKRNRQNSLLSEMRELLQSCSNGQEVPAIVISYATQLFPGTDGALFLLSDSKSDLQSVARWGDFPEDVDNNIFAPDACWGLRKGHVYAVADMKTGPICRHLKKTSSTAYICLPLIGKGEILGLLHLGTKQSVQENGRQENFSAMKEIAFIFAEYLALSIANIQLSEKLTSQSIRDPLTRLYNRRYMDEIIQHEILRAARQQTGIGVVMVDIDHFKQINDTYGHEAGDEYLIKLAGFFKLKARGSDFVFRYGGEEFMLILPESSIEDTYKYAESLRNEIKNMKVQFRGQALPSITLSFGIAAYPDHGLETIELLRVADKALYRAKEEGRDRVIIG